MADDLFAGGVAFLDEQVFLYVEADEFFAPAVVVTFTATHQGASATPTTLVFTENLTATPSTIRDPKKAVGKKATRIAWKVNINKNPNFKDTTLLFKYSVSGKATTGVNMVAATQDRIIIGAIRVTTDAKLTRIMLHEFGKLAGGAAVFDSGPLQAHLSTLTGEQKRTLFKHAIAKPDGRLVVFITIYAKKDLRMQADYCEMTPLGTPAPRHCVRPNATFSVYHCFDPLKGGVTLVCHTEHFVLNLKNSLGPTKKVKDPKTGVVTEVKRKDPRDTWLWIHSVQDRKISQDWLAKNNPRPIQHKIASEFPQGRNDGVIWSRIFTPKGRDIMLGNTMHGMINTVGCWMLFRNFNYHPSIARQADRTMRRTLREGLRSRMPAAAQQAVFDKAKDQLAAAGYDARTSTTTESSSFGKFLSFDRNFAYLWFFHEVVGIKYFSATHVGQNNVNDKTAADVHAGSLVNTFPLAQAGAAPAFNLPDEGTFAYHDSDDRKAADPSFQPSNSLWRVNAMGFQTSQGFIPNAKSTSDLTPGEIDQFSWADLYVYREDDVNVKNLTTQNYSESDPDV